jgi:L-alanine-DL-glutamate epimerase-like enolase superfamily enzyme
VTTIITKRRGLPVAGIAAVITGVAAIGLATAQEPEPTVAVDVTECVKLTTPDERLACFEKQVEGSRTNPTDPGATSTSRRTGRDGREEPPADIEARITELRETVPNSYVITLDNGQVWRQTVPKLYPMRPGHPVRVYYSKWNTYRLTSEPLKSFIQVERVR